MKGRQGIVLGEQADVEMTRGMMKTLAVVT
jgi:hypothetical protein